MLSQDGTSLLKITDFCWYFDMDKRCFISSFDSFCRVPSDLEMDFGRKSSLLEVPAVVDFAPMKPNLKKILSC